jgi:hypothetical protein
MSRQLREKCRERKCGGEAKGRKETAAAAAARCWPWRQVLKMKLDLQLRSGGAGSIDFDPASIMPASLNEDEIKMRGEKGGE